MPKLITFFFLLPLALWADMEEFNLTDGRALFAKIIEANDEKVVLERKDGLTFTLKPDAFTKEDQAAIKEWRIEQLLAKGELFKLTGKAFAADLKHEEEDGLVMKQWTCWYELEIENITTFDLKDVTLEYTFTVTRERLAKPVKADEPLKPETYDETIIIKDIAPGLPVAFHTPTITLKSTELEAGWSWPGGGDKPITDKINPLGARVMFRKKIVAKILIEPTAPVKKEEGAPATPPSKDE